MSEYWQDRQQKQRDMIANKTEKDINKQLTKYYKQVMNKVISDFEATYAKVVEARAEGKEVTPAWLYQLDRYWQLQTQLKEEAKKLGDKEIAIMSEKFAEEWNDVYKVTAVPSETAFSTVSTVNAQQMLNAVWCADGKTFSDRVWKNTERLVETLNEELVHCVVTGKKTTELRDKLVERFNVSRRQAQTLVRTEISHIQTAALVQKWKEYGVDKVKFLGRESGGCNHDPSCTELNGKIIDVDKLKYGENCPPIHPNCKCTLRAVIDIDDEKVKKENMNNETTKEKQTCLVCGKQYVPRGGYNVCQTCRNKLLKDNDVLSQMAKGYSKQDAVNYVSTWYEHVSIDKYVEAQEKMLSNRTSLYEEYRKLHTRAKKLETLGYESLGNGKWRKKFPEPEPKKNGRTATDNHGFYLDPDANYQYILEYNAWLQRKRAYDAKVRIVDENDLFCKCVDCGDVFWRKSNRQLRCAKCAKEHNKKNKAANARKNRNKKKNK